MAMPRQLRISRDRSLLAVVFAQETFEFPAEMLRVLSPSAEVQGHSASQRVTVGGKKDVKIRDVVATGHYAVRIVFDDGHDTGIYTWSFFEALGAEKEARWQNYLAQLEKEGLARE